MATKLAFTTLRDDLGGPLFWASHWQRLSQSWQYFKETKLSGEKQLHQQLCDYWSSHGDSIIRVELFDDGHFVLNPRPIVCADAETALKLTLAKDVLSARSHPSWLKAGDYSERLKRRETARQNEFDEVLYLDEEGNVAEASVSNIIWLKKNKLYAPAESKYFLQGITTRLLHSANPELFRSGCYALSELLAADAAWLVNAVSAPMRILSIGEVQLNPAVPQIDLVPLYWRLVKTDRDSRSE